MPPAPKSAAVAEFHGPYGPYQVSELVLQRVWLDGAFDATRLKDQWGRSVEVESPGSWNRLEGPDFKEARLIIAGVPVQGDVEVHFAQSDWRSHGHDTDPRYNNVVLHVVYHPLPKNGRAAVTQNGEEMPCVALMPCLWYSLEEYASDDSIVAIAGLDTRPEIEGLLQVDLSERRAQLVAAARERWDLKRRFALQRIATLGWVDACHQSAMEILGYARNRVAMLAVAGRYPLLSLLDGSVAVEELWEAGNGRWRLGGCRPVNHPRLRLEQYLNWVAARPCWPELLRELAADWPTRDGLDTRPKEAVGSSAARKALGVNRHWRRMSERILADRVNGAKGHSLVCDGFLPLASAALGHDYFPLWFHWNAGNGPAACVAALRRLEVVDGRSSPMSNGWLQGVLGLRHRTQ